MLFGIPLYFYEVLLVVFIVAVACALNGCFVVLHKQAMVADAISHSVLLGIVISYLIFQSLNSAWMILGAAVFGVLTVIFIELLIKRGKVADDAAPGIVFPLFFSIGVLLISTVFRSVHLCPDTVLMGEALFTILDRVPFLGLTIPRAVLTMGVVGLFNLAYILIFWKELKLCCFDEQYAKLAGFSLSFIHYSLMVCLSLNCVTAFPAVGSILVISFLVTPAASAWLVSKRLSQMVLLAIAYAAINCIMGFILMFWYNVNIAGAISAAGGVTFLITLLFCHDGIVHQVLLRRRTRKKMLEMLEKGEVWVDERA